MEVLFLGTGTSHGIPMIACRCPVCTSDDPRDHRTRPSILVTLDSGATILVDTSTDLRTQALRHGVSRVDAVVFTHSHADHIFGLDDTRRFNVLTGEPLPLYADAPTLEDLRRVFSYAFTPAPLEGGGTPALTLFRIAGPFTLLGQEVVPVPILHGRRPILGFRFGRFAYLTDCSSIPESSWPLLAGLDTVVVDALRDRPHPTHFTVAEAVDAARRIGARRTYLTHMCHDLGHAALLERLPSGIEPAHDGLRVRICERAVYDPVVPLSVIHFPDDRRPPEWRLPVVAVGNFDGVHRGHQKILDRIIRRANERGGTAVVLTFDPHPPRVVRPDKAPPLLMTPAQKLDALEHTGVGGVAVVRFTHELSQWDPERFVSTVLVDWLVVAEVWVGATFLFGRDRTGNFSRLRALGAQHGFRAEKIDPVRYKEFIVSSTRIRRLIAEGRVDEAGALLGRHYFLEGAVVPGDGRGRTIGFATANLAVENELLPPHGVYASLALFGDRVHPAITNIGTRPTFVTDGRSTVETHVLDADADLYGQRLRLALVQRLRDERAFADVEALRAQIEADCGRARALFRRVSL